MKISSRSCWIWSSSTTSQSFSWPFQIDQQRQKQHIKYIPIDISGPSLGDIDGRRSCLAVVRQSYASNAWLDPFRVSPQFASCFFPPSHHNFARSTSNFCALECILVPFPSRRGWQSECFFVTTRCGLRQRVCLIFEAFGPRLWLPGHRRLWVAMCYMSRKYRLEIARRIEHAIAPNKPDEGPDNHDSPYQSIQWIDCPDSRCFDHGEESKGCREFRNSANCMLAATVHAERTGSEVHELHPYEAHGIDGAVLSLPIEIVKVATWCDVGDSLDKWSERINWLGCLS